MINQGRYFHRGAGWGMVQRQANAFEEEEGGIVIGVNSGRVGGGTKNLFKVTKRLWGCLP